jgi:ABC-2 type transport system permease protein
VDVTVITMFTSMIGTFLALIYTILVANSLIASKIDRGSMAYILSTPIRRSTVTNTQTAFMLCSVVSMYTLVCVANIIIFAATGVSFNAGKLIIAYFGFILFTVMISSIAFAASCYFNLSKLSLAVGGGIPILFYVLTIMMQISTDLEFFKYLTINSFFSKDVINNIYGISVSSGSSPLGRGGADAIPKKGMEKNM